MNSSSNTTSDSQFGKHLSRKDIADIRDGKTNAAATDDFEKDALQGWQKASAGMELMHKTDRRFLSGNRWIYLTSAIIAAVICVFFLLPKSETSKPAEVAAKTKVTIDKSDVLLAEEIKHFEELPADLQIRPEQVVSNFKSKDQQAKEQVTDNSRVDEDQLVLPLKKIQVYSNTPKVTLDKKFAKEVYLANFKLVDYRVYRSKPAIPSEQMILTGTPADQEKNLIQDNDPAWKAIDIPYQDYIAQTMEQFKSGNFKQTLNRTKFILGFYPDDVNALFYGGLCYYNLSEMNQAIDAFQQVIANPFSNFDEEALWYLANAYDLNNDKVKAKELFQLIANQKGYYAKQAEKRK